MRDNMKKLLVLLLCVALVFAFTSCGSKDEPQQEEQEDTIHEEIVDDSEDLDPNDPANDPVEQTEEEEGEEEEVTEPEETVIEFREDKEEDLATLQETAENSTEPHTGTYIEIVAGRGIIIVNKFTDVYSVVVNWSDSAYESYEWTFTGNFDSDGVLEYSDCLKKDIVYEVEEEGEVSVVYKNGTGRLRLTGEGLIWEDDMEHVADDADFVFSGM
ncbi:MAG: hypothetical protein IKS99_07475 [Firmicutes bacterium]|nr:hypothetical protein [Bacillota bacterium]